MPKPNQRHIGLLFILLLIAMLGMGMGLQRTVAAFDDIDQAMRKLRMLTSILYTIKEHYVDPEKTSDEDLINGAIHGMVSSLDRYSIFLEPEEAKEFNDQTQGMFGGLGIQINMVDDWLTVVEPLPGTPAAEAGLLSGDRIVAIEGESTQGINIYEAVKQLKGEPGTQVTITIARKGEREFFDRTITRAIIHTRAVEQSEQFMLDDRIGYIRLRDFTRDADKELEDAIRKLQAKGMTGLIFDLRDNVGGLLDVAVRVSDLFLDRGKEIVSHRNNRGIEKVHRAERDSLGDFLLVVLVNEFSASASEIVAGSIQDHGRGVLVGPQGHRTFGKGSVQTLIESKELQGGALKLTTAKYYTPSGFSIEDEKGLKPDIFARVTDLERIAIRRAGKVGRLPADMLDAEPIENEIAIRDDDDEPLSVDDVFNENDAEGDSDVDQELYDVELLTAYQCIKGALVMERLRGDRYTLAPSRN